MAETLRHCGIVVPDLQVAVDLFWDYLGCETVTRLEALQGDYFDTLLDIEGVELNIAILRTNDDCRIELLQYTSAPAQPLREVCANTIGVSHIALTVPNLESLYDQREAYPVRYLSPPITNPEGSVKVAYVVLMEACLVELVEVLTPDGATSGGN